MKEFLFKLFRLEWEKPKCENCENLLLLIESERLRSERLMQAILQRTEPIRDIPRELPPEAYAQRPHRYTPWSVTRQKLEEADRIKAASMRKSGQVMEEKRKIEAQERVDAIVDKVETRTMTEDKIDELEKELGVGEEVNG